MESDSTIERQNSGIGGEELMEINANYVMDEMAKTIMQLQVEKAVLSAQVRQLSEQMTEQATEQTAEQAE
jgi:hypothetical protein